MKEVKMDLKDRLIKVFNKFEIKPTFYRCTSDVASILVFSEGLSLYLPNGRCSDGNCVLCIAEDFICSSKGFKEVGWVSHHVQKSFPSLRGTSYFDVKKDTWISSYDCAKEKTIELKAGRYHSYECPELEMCLILSAT